MFTLIYKRPMALAQLVITGWLATASLCCPTNAGAITSGTNVAPLQHLEDTCTLDARRLYALGMIETGNDDRAIGAAGEVSRYQLSPPVWKSYSKSVDYQNPEVALQVARLHWIYLAAYFKEKSGRAPSDYDMYVLWNTRHGYYARKGFSPHRIAAVVQDRSQRFVNLINRKE